MNPQAYQNPNQQQFQQQQTNQNLVSPNAFGIIVPGQMPITQFQQINDMYVCDVQNPALINSLTFFITQQVPDNFGVSLSYTVAPYQSLQFIGAVANQRPTDIFHTGFPLNPDVNQQQSIKLVVKVEQLENLKGLVQETENNDVSKNYAKLVAQNLHNFMLSYQQMGLLSQDNEGKYIVVPSNFLEKWLQKFEIKYKYDPNFIYKTSND